MNISRTVVVPIFAIAKNAFREALRNKILGALVFSALFMIGTGLALSQMSLHEERRVIADFSFWSLSIISMLISIYASVTLVSSEKKDRTIYTIVSKPIPRWTFIVGKYFGVMALVTLNVLVLWGISSGLMWLLDSPMESAWLAGPLCVLLQCTLLVALSLLFSTLSSPLLSGIFSATLWIIGNLQTQLTQILNQGFFFGSFSPYVKYAQRLLPNFEALNISSEITHVVPVPEGYLFAAVWYTLSFSAVILMLACWRFSMDEVK